MTKVAIIGAGPCGLSMLRSFEVVEKNLEYNDLVEADEAFFTGTAVEITPISKLDNNSINNGSRGEITKQLQEKFQEIISGHDKFYQSWLTFIK